MAAEEGEAASGMGGANGYGAPGAVASGKPVSGARTRALPREPVAQRNEQMYSQSPLFTSMVKPDLPGTSKEVPAA